MPTHADVGFCEFHMRSLVHADCIVSCLFGIPNEELLKGSQGSALKGVRRSRRSIGHGYNSAAIHQTLSFRFIAPFVLGWPPCPPGNWLRHARQPHIPTAILLRYCFIMHMQVRSCHILGISYVWGFTRYCKGCSAGVLQDCSSRSQTIWHVRNQASRFVWCTVAAFVLFVGSPVNLSYGPSAPGCDPPDLV